MKKRYKLIAFSYLLGIFPLFSMENNQQSPESLLCLATKASLIRFQSMTDTNPSGVEGDWAKLPEDLKKRIAEPLAEEIYQQLRLLHADGADAVKEKIENDLGKHPELLSNLIKETVRKLYGVRLGNEIQDFRRKGFARIFYNGKIISGKDGLVQPEQEDWGQLGFSDILSRYVERTKTSLQRSRRRR